MATRLLNTQRIVNLASDPGSGNAGEVYYNTVASKLKFYNGSSWAEIGSGGAGTVTSVGLSVPTGLSVSNSPITSSGTLAISLSAGYTIPTTTELNAKAPLASPTFTGTVTAATLDLTTAATSTAATSYFVETGSDGVVRPKTLANVRTEIVTTAAVNSAAATTVGTITSGTWQGSEISTTYTAAKVTSVNGSTGAVTGLATTAGKLSQFAATTSAELAGVISDETGSGVLVFGTAPNFTTDIEVNAGSLSSTAATVLTPLALNATTTNGDYLRFKLTRESTGSDWTTAGWRMQRTVDVTNMGYVEFGSTNAHDVRIGSNATDIAVFAPSQITFSQEAIFPASTTSAASINIPHGTAPTAPSNGDIWTTTTGLFARINGTTEQYAKLASPTFTGTVTASTLDLTTAATSTAATSYFVETGSDGIIRPKTLANVRTEIVTTASVNAAAATTVGTITSGTWQGSVISATYIDSAIARLASPTFTGTLTAATGAFTGSVNMNHNTQTRPASGSGVTINWNWTGGQADVDFWNVYTPATTAFVFKQLTGASTHTDLLTIFSNGNATLNGTLTATSYSGGASLTGTPTAPTAAAGTNTTQIATTAYVTTAVAAAGGGGFNAFFLGGM